MTQDAVFSHARHTDTFYRSLEASSLLCAVSRRSREMFLKAVSGTWETCFPSWKLSCLIKSVNSTYSPLLILNPSQLGPCLSGPDRNLHV